MFKKEQILFIGLGGFFICNALVAEFIGGKIFSLESTLGIDPLRLNIFGNELSFNMTAGVLLWPLVFIMTDIINEYYGKRGIRIISWLAAGLILYSFVMVWISMQLHPATFWEFTDLPGGGQLNRETAFDTVFWQGNWIIVGSLVAFLVGQFVDVDVFHYLRRFTGSAKIWLRATGSTLVSQFIDSFVVLFIGLYLSGTVSLELMISIGIVNYIYKFAVAIFLTPLIYLSHGIIDRYLGEELARKMTEEAAHQGPEKEPRFTRDEEQ